VVAPGAGCLTLQKINQPRPHDPFARAERGDVDFAVAAAWGETGEAVVLAGGVDHGAGDGLAAEIADGRTFAIDI
jgi:hypothetical protein